MNGKRLTAMGLIVTLGVSAAACGKTEKAEEVSKVAVEVQNPEIGELTADTAYIGAVSPQEQVYVIPKVSGTVTETFFDVGDTVQEGDVLFKIDDEAYRLQLASAQAAYNSAQAGVVAQNGGARDLQNYQTERQIQMLQESLDDTYEDIDDLEDDIDDIKDAKNKLASGQAQAQAKLGAVQNEISELQKRINALTKPETGESGTGAGTSTGENAGTGDENENGDGSGTGGSEGGNTDPQEQLKALQASLAEKEAVKKELQAQISSIQGQISELDTAKSQLRSGVDQLEDGQDTIRDNLITAEQAYAITQNEIYPQTDAASAAQLQQVAVGIDSAQMQLDYCTVKAPIGGVVESVSVEKNGMAAAGNIAYIISNKDSMKVTFNVTEQAKNALSEGDHITAERNGVTYDGIVTQIGTMAGAQTRLFEIEATLAGAGGSLPSGVTVKVYATTQREEGKLIVPYDAIYFSAADAYVYCVEDNVIVKTPVTVGLMTDTQAVIEEGLTEDSLIVDNWSSKLRNGAEVEIVSINGEAVINEAGPEEASGEETVEEETSEADVTEEQTEEEETPESEEAPADVTEEAE